MARGAGRRSPFFFRVPSVRMGMSIGASRRKRARRRRLSALLGLRHRRGPRPVGLLFIFAFRPAPSVQVILAKVLRVDRRAHVSPRFGSPHRAGFGRGATARPSRHYRWQEVSERSNDCYRSSVHSFSRAKRGRQRIFRKLSGGQASISAQIQREATRQRKSSATRRQRRGCGAQ